jgi:hypothetical protein
MAEHEGAFVWADSTDDDVWSSAADEFTVRASGGARFFSSADLSTWRYRAQEKSVRHMGPVAQDFHAAFGLGDDERRISSVDVGGVTLAAIQGLYQRLQLREAELEETRRRNEVVEARLATLEALVAGIAAQQAGGQ